MTRTLRILFAGEFTDLNPGLDNHLHHPDLAVGTHFVSAPALVEAALVSGDFDLVVLEDTGGPLDALALLARSKHHFVLRPVIMLARPERAEVLAEALEAGLDEGVVAVGPPDVQRRLLAAAIRRSAAAPRGVLVSSADDSERKRLELQLRHIDKMQAIGQLAGGIAHDFNNILTIITSYSYLLMTELDEDSPLRLSANKILSATERGATLTRQLLAFSRRQALRPEPLCLTSMIEQMAPMLRQLFARRLSLKFALAPDLAPVLCDRASLEQVVMNLVLNARDACGAGARLTIETRAVTLDQPLPGSHGEVPRGRYAVLSVCDNGHGIDPDTLAHIFDPFFTTKPAGEGTGLGLASVFGIVKQSAGHVTVETGPDCGTRFDLYLPLQPAGLDPGAADERSRRPESDTLYRGSETILLVDDEEAVRPPIREMLTRAGYTVLEARDATDARRACAEHAGPLDLVITDVIMPGVSGVRLAEALLLEHPALRVILMSGYPDDQSGPVRTISGQATFVSKPFTLEFLARLVREVLDRACEPA